MSSTTSPTANPAQSSSKAPATSTSDSPSDPPSSSSAAPSASAPDPASAPTSQTSSATTANDSVSTSADATVVPSTIAASTQAQSTDPSSSSIPSAGHGASSSTSTSIPAPSKTPTPTVTEPGTEDVDMAVSTVHHPADFVNADVATGVAAPLKSISQVASATIPHNLPLLGSMSSDDAQRFGLGHINGVSPAAAPYSSPAQVFRPASNSPQPFQTNKVSPPTPVVKPTDVTPAPTSAGPTSTSAADSVKMAPVVAGIGTLPPNVEASAAAAAGGSGDSLRVIPTNKNNPAFLNKLRSMVDDPNTDELIRWSSDGASFFVPNHVKFGDQVLPRFFKHNRFSSFVRQLNMYGFHKVPHLQQGALKHDSPQESELWEFSNPHFHRDHPEWLSKVQRKKGARDDKDGNEREHSSGTGQELMHAGALMRTDFGAQAIGAEANGEGALQLASVLNAINAIKNAQTSINADIRHLQNSNQNLWQEAVESRQRAKRQQETINKILRFLAGVFGNDADAEAPVQGKKVSGKGRGGGRRVGVRPQGQGAGRNKGRLMIEDGKSSPRRGLEGLELPASDEEIEEMPSHLRFKETGSGDSPKGGQSPANSGSRITQIPSPPSSSAAANEFDKQLHEAVSTPGGSRRLSSQASNQVLNALASGEGNAWLASLFGANLANQGSKSTGPASGGGLKLDPQMVAALQQALASAGTGGGAGNAGESGADYFGSTNADAADDFSSRFEAFPSAASGSDSTQQPSGSGSALGLDADALARIAGISQALVQSPARVSPTKASGSAANLFDTNLSDDAGNNQQLALSLSRASRDLQNISNDANLVQNSINSLVQGLQVPTSAAAAPGGWQNPTASTAPYVPGAGFDANIQLGLTGATPLAGQGVDTDFDVDSFLSQFVDSSQAPGGGVVSPMGGQFADMNESPSFAFSPATTAAFLQGSSNAVSGDAGSSSSGGGTSESSPEDQTGEWNQTGAQKGKKRKPSASGMGAAGGAGMGDVEMGRPSKKSASRK